MGYLWGRLLACALVSTCTLVSKGYCQDPNPSPSPLTAVVEQPGGEEQAIAELIITREEAASGRAFDPLFRAQVKADLASRSLEQLAAVQKRGTGLLPSPNNLGDSQADLVYTPVIPCRIIDTRLAGGAIGAGTTRSFLVTGTLNFPPQGGTSGGCGIPNGSATAAVINFVAVSPAGPGDLRITPFGTAIPLASIINYSNGDPNLNIANGPVVTMCNPATATCTNDITVQADASAVQIVADVQGYFRNALGAHLDASNTGVGIGSLSGNTGVSNTAFGAQALPNNTAGSFNSAFGRSALRSGTFSANSAFGSLALGSLTAGGFNSGFGQVALGSLTTGSSNSAFGNQALQGLASGSSNIAVGSIAGLNLLTGSNNIYLGNNGASSESSVIRIGDVATHAATFIAGISGATSASGVAVFVNGSGQRGTTTSSRRFKDAIGSMGEESDVLMKLRPVAFYYKPGYDDTRTRQYGLVAEEVAEVAPQLVVSDQAGAPQTVRYHFVNAMLLNEVQKQRTTIVRQESRIQELTARLARLEAALAG